MVNCDYCGGKGWCWLPYQVYEMPYSWSSGRRAKIVTFEKCICPMCLGFGKTLFPLGLIGEWIQPKFLY